MKPIYLDGLFVGSNLALARAGVGGGQVGDNSKKEGLQGGFLVSGAWWQLKSGYGTGNQKIKANLFNFNCFKYNLCIDSIL